ncbi:hypothetical protein KVP09_01330 [Alcaligenaceae bacterium CGII-47]|nr:hypothetical protein [Alcaligenaceae bacterium CGII-47]
MQRALGFDNSPDLSVPLRFFLNIPVFILLAGTLVLWAGPAVFSSRWSLATLALTHLFTLGILGSAMLGAMMQILPVACNIHFPYARHTSCGIHALLTFGTLALVMGFLDMRPIWFASAAVLLAFALLGFISITSIGLWQHRRQVYKGAREILVTVRLALIGLVITVILGVTLAGAMAQGNALPALTDLHAVWGLAGWAGILLIGISFQLIPIFQVTEIYPKLLTRWLAIVILGIVLAWSALSLSDALPSILREATELLLVAAYGLYAMTTFHLLWTRKRPKAEPTTLFWRLAMLCLIACAPVWLWLTSRHDTAATLLLGSLIIVGTLWSAVNGMLYKIVPFLLWKHAQDAMIIPDHDPAQARAYLRVMPKIAAYLPESRANGQFIVHALAVVTWMGACIAPHWLAYPAGGLLLISGIWLAANMMSALMIYQRTLKAMAAMPLAANLDNSPAHPYSTP